ncbi:MAG TPA: hypothetical protein ACYCDB_00375 [Candidatus Azoamicus sp.]
MDITIKRYFTFLGPYSSFYAYLKKKSYYFYPIDMLLLDELSIFSIIIKQNKKYNYHYKNKIFPCIINNSKNSKFIIFNFIKINNNRLISVKNILKLIKKISKKPFLFSENKFHNFNTFLDLFVYK